MQDRGELGGGQEAGCRFFAATGDASESFHAAGEVLDAVTPQMEAGAQSSASFGPGSGAPPRFPQSRVEGIRVKAAIGHGAFVPKDARQPQDRLENMRLP